MSDVPIDRNSQVPVLRVVDEPKSGYTPAARMGSGRRPALRHVNHVVSLAFLWEGESPAMAEKTQQYSPPGYCSPLAIVYCSLGTPEQGVRLPGRWSCVPSSSSNVALAKAVADACTIPQPKA